MDIKIYKDIEETCRMLAHHMKELIERSSGDFHLVLSGGSTPKQLFDILARDFSDIDWGRVHFYWSDERCVDYCSEESNYGVAQKRLLTPLNIPTDHIHPVKTSCSPVVAAVDYEEVISNQVPSSCGVPRFDLVILGMGDDGHTASIFPDQLEFITSEKLCEVAKHPQTGQVRVTLTGKLINSAENIVFLCTGANKAERVFDVVVEDNLELPASYIKALDGSVDWFLDESAASRLIQ
jgi:6-phosphogluconolactonase